MIRREDIVQKINSLPTFNDVVSKISRLLHDKEAGIKDFERAVKPDPALTTNLLRIANSSYFGLTRTVTSIGQAVNLLGAERIHEIATSVSYSLIIPKVIPGYGIDSKAFWQHSVAVAVFAEQMAIDLGIGNKDLLFTAGLLHDIGKLVIGSFLSLEVDEIMQALRENKSTFIQAERDSLGVDHTEIGMEMAEKWNLPESIGLAVRWHHDPDSADAGDDQPVVDLIHSANSLAHMMGYGADIGELSRSIHNGPTKRLGFKVQQLEAIVGRTMEEILEMTNQLGNSGESK